MFMHKMKALRKVNSWGREQCEAHLEHLPKTFYCLANCIKRRSSICLKQWHHNDHLILLIRNGDDVINRNAVISTRSERLRGEVLRNIDLVGVVGLVD